MLLLLQPASIWGQLASFWFFCAAIFGEILLIRVSLTLAYVFLFIAACLGYPSWIGFYQRGIAIDGLVWAFLSGSLHAVALYRLWRDERPIKFASEEEEQLYKFFNRRSGCRRLEFQSILQSGQWMKVPAGRLILMPSDASRMLCLLVDGIASFTNIFPDPISGETREQRDVFLSGSFFDKRLLSIFGLYIGFEHGRGQKRFTAVAETDCLLFTWTAEDLNRMATQMGPAVSAYWRNCIATSLGLEFEWRQDPSLPRFCATGDLEDYEMLKGARSRDFTDPFRSYEKPTPTTMKGWLKWIYNSLHPLMPRGIRHNDLPIHGIMARNRVLALRAAQVRQILSDYAEDVSVKGATEAMRLLMQQQSLRKLEATDASRLAEIVARYSQNSSKRPSLEVPPNEGERDKGGTQQAQQHEECENGQLDSKGISNKV